MLNRAFMTHLEKWRYKLQKRKPLLIRGARQVGKTTLVRIFAQQQGLELIEINMEKPWRFITTLDRLDPKATIEAIEFELNVDIDPEKSIIFFDEVQACPAVLPLLRYFYEETPEYMVIATGSLLDFVLADPDFSMPVGRIELLHLSPMTFEEFLQAIGEEKSLCKINNYQLGDGISLPVHEKLSQLARIYSIVGGMPEVVDSFVRNRSYKEVEKIKSEIIETFRLDFNKYKGKTDSQLLAIVFDAIPRLMGQKLIYSRIDSGYRSNDLVNAVEQLRLARIITKVFNCHANGIPLGAEKKERFFKLLYLDIGLLLTQFRLVPTEIEQINELNLVNKGVLAEQFIGQHLYIAHPYYREPELYYWAREEPSASSEVDFLIEDGVRRIVPVEVKAGSTGGLRSLQIMVQSKSLSVAVRFCSEPPTVFSESRRTVKGGIEFELISLPHYLVQQVSRLLIEK